MTVEIILNLKPHNLEFMKFADYTLGVFEKFAQDLKVQMQLEKTAEGILVFFKTRADLENILQAINHVSLEANTTFTPSEKKRAWQVVIIKPRTEDQTSLLQNLTEKCSSFVGQYGRIELVDGKVEMLLPENFHLDTFSLLGPFPRKAVIPVKSPAKKNYDVKNARR